MVKDPGILATLDAVLVVTVVSKTPCLIANTPTAESVTKEEYWK